MWKALKKGTRTWQRPLMRWVLMAVWVFLCADALWKVNAGRVAADTGLSMTDTHWPGEWVNLLCPPPTAAECARGITKAGWPAGLPELLDAEARSRLTHHAWSQASGQDAIGWEASSMPPPELWIHGLAGVYEGTHAQRPRKVLLAYVSKPEAWECHACAPWASFFEFEALGPTRWRLARAALGAAQWGAWGEMASIHVLPLSGHQIGVWFAMGYTAQGFTTETLAAYAWVGTRLQPVFEELVGERDGNEQDVSWQAHWWFARSADGSLVVELRREPGPEALSGPFMLRNQGPGANGTDADGQLARRAQWHFDGERFVATAITN